MSRAKVAAFPFTVRVDADDDAGWGYAIHLGKRLRIKGAIQGELLEVKGVRFQERHLECRVERLLEHSPLRVQPACAHFAYCGGCSQQHLSGALQLQRKWQQLESELNLQGLAAPSAAAPITGPLWGYRRKARLSVRFTQKNERVFIGFREAMSHQVADIQSCAVLAAPFATLIEPMRALVEGLTVRAAIPQIEIAVGDQAAALVIRHVMNLTQADSRALLAFERSHGVAVYLQSGGPASLMPLSAATPALTYSVRALDDQLAFTFGPLDFVQVNGVVNQGMIERALDWLAIRPHERVLDLFCGLGNFSLPMALQARQVVGIENEASLVQLAKQNAQANRAHNVQFVAMDLHGNDSSRLHRLAEGERKFDVVLLDPPRSGAGAAVGAIGALGAQRLLYVSCNAKSFALDAKALATQGFGLKRLAIADMFPHTSHSESLALFERG